MNDPQLKMLGIGALALVVGISGWLLPYRWNILRLKRCYAQMLSEKTNRMIPKIVGAVLVLVGLVTMIVALSISKD